MGRAEALEKRAQLLNRTDNHILEDPSPTLAPCTEAAARRLFLVLIQPKKGIR